MDFKTFWFAMGQEERATFADSVARSQGYLQLVAGGFRNASPHLAKTIEEESGGKVRREEMREDVFGPVPAPPGEPPQGEGRVQ